MRDVAELARVSQSSVSNYFHKPHKISDATRERIRQAVQTPGFVPNDAARMLRTGTSPVVGYVAFEPASATTPQIAAAIEQRVSAEGMYLLMANNGGSRLRERRCFAAMAAWVDVVRERTGGALLREERLQFGDWLDPDAPPDRPGDAKTDAGIVATAYFHRSAALTAKAAALLGRDADARRYGDLAARVADAFRAAYVTPRGRMMSDAPTAYALALVFGLTPDGQRQALGDRLKELVRAAGYRITTGFVGTPVICEALASTGHPDAASRHLTQTECPSWLYPVTMGATTVRERWDSMLPDGSVNPGLMTSFSHYALGGVADWLHRRVAGLAVLEPGYRVVHVSPTLLDDLDDASAWHETPYGPARAGWRREGARVHFHAEIPPNTRGVVELPSGARYEVG
ncbi:alpha-L-rhamnosidase C-terminal domain-containing protein [Streptomyces sp. ST1015]|uniref:alpha-L-rhamnosidase-related protein n=1 Tax=Streptomyces sp. ST1015 TaxID=1848900 RepID=UPI00223B48C9|nr:alpha-L-rhamnosidase C-terminal domain-containing protein [Streptomyces sp. ST1015]